MVEGEYRMKWEWEQTDKKIKEKGKDIFYDVICDMNDKETDTLTDVLNNEQEYKKLVQHIIDYVENIVLMEEIKIEDPELWEKLNK